MFIEWRSMAIKRVIFVDFDGVLNDPLYLIKTGLQELLDPTRVAILKCICDRTKAKVVLTSSWRDSLEGRRLLKKGGVPVIGATPHKKDNRGEEIHQWLIDKKFDGDWIIIDDEASELSEAQHARLICTREGEKLGLQKKHIGFAERLFQDYTAFPWADKTFIACILAYIQDDLLRVMYNVNQEDYDSKNPFQNTGNVEGFSTETFEVHAYDWGWNFEGDAKKPAPVNFKWRDLEIYWYKWFGRDIYTNRPVTHDELAIMLSECLESLRNYERSKDAF